NLVGYLVWELPGAKQTASRAARWSRGWTVAALGAARSGPPFTVNAPSLDSGNNVNQGLLFNNRADIVDPQRIWAGGAAVAGGKLLLNSDAFRVPAPG